MTVFLRKKRNPRHHHFPPSGRWRTHYLWCRHLTHRLLSRYLSHLSETSPSTQYRIHLTVLIIIVLVMMRRIVLIPLDSTTARPHLSTRDHPVSSPATLPQIKVMSLPLIATAPPQRRISELRVKSMHSMIIIGDK